MGVNEVRILGNLGQDPETRMTPQGKSVTSFTVATSDSYTDAQGNKKERTEWHRVVIWGKLGDVCSQYLKKGSKVFIGGEIRTRKWKDQQNIERYTTEIIANKVEFLDGRPQGGQSPQRPQQAVQPHGPAAYNSDPSDLPDDDVPF